MLIPGQKSKSTGPTLTWSYYSLPPHSHLGSLQIPQSSLVLPRWPCFLKPRSSGHWVPFILFPCQPGSRLSLAFKTQPPGRPDPTCSGNVSPSCPYLYFLCSFLSTNMFKSFYPQWIASILLGLQVTTHFPSSLSSKSSTRGYSSASPLLFYTGSCPEADLSI